MHGTKQSTFIHGNVCVSRHVCFIGNKKTQVLQRSAQAVDFDSCVLPVVFPLIRQLHALFNHTLLNLRLQADFVKVCLQNNH